MSIRCPTAVRPAGHDAAPRDPARAWYRQGIVWLGIAVFAASVAGSIWLITVAERYVDPPLPVSGPHVLREVPVARPPPASETKP